MADLFASGHIVDLILGLVALEWIVLAAYHRGTGLGLAPIDLTGNLLSGISLMLALRAALVGLWWGWVALGLAAALLAHAFDLWRRWQK